MADIDSQYQKAQEALRIRNLQDRAFVLQYMLAQSDITKDLRGYFAIHDELCDVYTKLTGQMVIAIMPDGRTPMAFAGFGGGLQFAEAEGAQIARGLSKWPARFRLSGAYTAEELLQFDCVVDAGRIANAIGGKVIRITPKGGAPLLGEIRLPNGQILSGWAEHSAVLKAGRIFDRITGPNGLSIEEYKALFKHADNILFEGL